MRYILTGGGTGGHIFSAIATADEIKKRDADAVIIFVGSKDYMEMDIVPKAGYEIVGMNVHRINRFNLWKNYKQPFEVISSLWQSRKLIKRFKPDAVIGTGGFATGPILKMAQISGIPTFLQEHNAFPGLTTRLLAKNATRIHIAYDEVRQHLKKGNFLLTGNPVREDLTTQKIDIKQAKKQLKFDPEKPLISIIGGSQGSDPINKVMMEIFPKLKQNNIQMLLQTGKNFYHLYKDFKDEQVQITPFIDDIPLIYSASDVIITRSGAMTIAELALFEKASVLIPIAHSEQSHQDHNALALANKHAAVYVKESEMYDKLAPEIIRLVNNPQEIKTIEKNIKPFAFPKATEVIVDDILGYLEER